MELKSLGQHHWGRHCECESANENEGTLDMRSHFLKLDVTIKSGFGEKADAVVQCDTGAMADGGWQFS